MSFFKRLVASAIAFWVATLLLGDNFTVVGQFNIVEEYEWVGQSAVFLVIALLFTLMNAIVKPVLKVLSLPLVILTFGLFLLVINAVLILLLAWLTDGQDWGLVVGNFGWAVLAGLIISVVSTVLNSLLRSEA